MRNNSMCEGKPQKCSSGLLLIDQTQRDSEFLFSIIWMCLFLKVKTFVYTLMHVLYVLYGERSVFSLDYIANNYFDELLRMAFNCFLSFEQDCF